MPIINKTFVVEYDLFDVTAKDDATCTTEYNEDFANVELLTEGSEFPDYATMEHNFFVLDGTKEVMSETVNPIGFFSTSMSDANGNFAENPTIEISFTENHSTVALGLYFEDDYPLHCIVTYKTLSGIMLNKHEFDITSNYACLEYAQAEYGYISIEFTKALPFRYVKLNRIEFGRQFVWDETNIISGNMVEEKSLISETIPINSLSFEFLDFEDMYNLNNSSGYHLYIQKGQHIKPFEYIGDTKTYLGKYFVNKFSSNLNAVKFDCRGAEGNLDNFTFYKGTIYNGELAGVIIESIFAICGITDYTIDEPTYNSPIYGALPPVTCREALTKVLFACNSVFDNCRTDTVHIRKPERFIKGRIGINRKISTKPTLNEYVSGVKIGYAVFNLENETSEILKEDFLAGTHLIQFDEPYAEITTSGGEILESGTFYCILKVTEPAEIILSGIKYDKTDLHRTIKVEKVASGEAENIKEFKDVLVSSKTVDELGKKLLEHFSLRLNIDIQFLADYENILSWYLVENPNPLYNDYIAGISSMTTDLVGGFIANAKVVGYYNLPDNFYYSGSELYSEDDIII